MTSPDPSIIPTILSGAFGLIGTIVAALIGKDLISRKRLREQLAIAQGDIAFLLQVEALHCDLHRLQGNATYKFRIRKEVMQSGLSWSGRFTPGRVRYSTNAIPTSRSWWERIASHLNKYRSQEFGTLRAHSAGRA